MLVISTERDKQRQRQTETETERRGGGGREKQTDRQTETVRITMNEITENIKSNRLDVCLLLLLKIVDALAKYPAIFFSRCLLSHYWSWAAS